MFQVLIFVVPFRETFQTVPFIVLNFGIDTVTNNSAAYHCYSKRAENPRRRARERISFQH